MRVLMTGGAGYIGSVLAEDIVAAGHELTVYDSLVRGHRDAVPEQASFVPGDILDGERLLGVLRAQRTEAVVHMAALIAVGESVADPSAYYRVNLQGGLSVLEAARAADVSTILFSSTAAVYGEPEEHPIPETHPTRPTSPYGDAKLAFERALRWYANAYGLRYTALRYFNAAGASARNGERHDPETHLVPLALRAAVGEIPALTVFGDDYPTRDGTCLRDYIHVLDLSRAHLLALEAMARGGPSGVFNLGCGGDGYSVLEVIRTVEQVTGRPVPFRIGPRRAGDPAVLVASSERIRAQLGWQPRFQDLGAIVDSAWRWLRSRRQPRVPAKSEHRS